MGLCIPPLPFLSWVQSFKVIANTGFTLTTLNVLVMGYNTVQCCIRMANFDLTFGEHYEYSVCFFLVSFITGPCPNFEKWCLWYVNVQ